MLGLKILLASVFCNMFFGLVINLVTDKGRTAYGSMSGANEAPRD